ncbi:winged helix-turn-helix domain-containing protein [Jeotgalibacillus marinus]|uniref:Helix-turn-helix domain-containing protein n=1 Tax=Jeotgalibacillus marinus TaxID=86667 RepID=A0ABV3Q5H8_9BACL
MDSYQASDQDVMGYPFIIEGEIKFIKTPIHYNFYEKDLTGLRSLPLLYEGDFHDGCRIRDEYSQTFFNMLSYIDYIKEPLEVLCLQPSKVGGADEDWSIYTDGTSNGTLFNNLYVRHMHQIITAKTDTRPLSDKEKALALTFLRKDTDKYWCEEYEDDDYFEYTFREIKENVPSFKHSNNLGYHIKMLEDAGLIEVLREVDEETGKKKTNKYKFIRLPLIF